MANRPDRQFDEEHFWRTAGWRCSLVKLPARDYDHWRTSCCRRGEAALLRMRSMIREGVETMTTHAQFIEAHCSARLRKFMRDPSSNRVRGDRHRRGERGLDAAAILGRRLIHAASASESRISGNRIIGVGRRRFRQSAVQPGARIDEESSCAKPRNHQLGIEFKDWQGPGTATSTPSAFTAQPEQVSIHQDWLKLRELGDKTSLEEFSLIPLPRGSAEFPRPAERGSSLTVFVMPFTLMQPLSEYLRSYALARGVVRLERKIVRVDLRSADGFIRALQLDVVNKSGRSVHRLFRISRIAD